MNGLSTQNSTRIYVELGAEKLIAFNGDEGLELALARQEDGRLTPICREQLVQALTPFLRRHAWSAPTRVFCALNLRGVSLRRCSVPATDRKQWHHMLSLQVESEFPLPPSELAWGYRLLDDAQTIAGAPTEKREVLLAAAKRELVQDYAGVFTACGAVPVFTIAALARARLCPPSNKAYAVLDIGRRQSELVVFEGQIPASLRILPWGSENAREAGRVQPSDCLPGERSASKLYLTGNAIGADDLRRQLGQHLGGLSGERLAAKLDYGRSAATVGLRETIEQNGGAPWITIDLGEPADKPVAASKPSAKWWVLAAALAAMAIVLPQVESWILQPGLARQVADILSNRGVLASIDSEFGFLQNLRKYQSPYLDTLYLLSRAAPSGSRFDTVSMNRRGELSLRGSLRDGQQVVDFRAKLLESGFFSHVTVEEQTPTPDRQKVNVRITAQWKALENRPPVPEESSAIEGAKKTMTGRKPDSTTGLAPSSNALATPKN